MTIERKAFKAIYKLIQSGSVTEKQAYDLCLAVFFMPPQIIPQPMETPSETENNGDKETVVKGFVGEGPESGRRATNGTRKV